MTNTSKTRRALAGIALTGALVAGTAAVASAQPTDPGQGTQQQVRRGERAKRVAARKVRQATRGVHGDTIVKGKDGQWVTITWDRGEVTAASATSVTLARKDGVSVTIKLDATTTFHGISDATGLRTGEPALVISKAGTATQVAQRKAS